jgi:ABC-type transport system involved in multi-copper enzyme maturation permease subunit
MMRKSIFIAIAVLLVFLVLYAFLRHPGLMDGTNYYKPYEGPITTEKVKIAHDQFDNLKYSAENEYKYGVLYDIAVFSPEEIKNTTSYDDSGNVKERTVNVSEIYYNKPWGYLLEYIDQFGVVFMITMILLGLAPVFAEEYALGTAALLRSSKRGKGQLVLAKLMASMLYILICVVLFTGVNLLVYWLRFGNLAGADTSIQSVGMYFYSFDYEFSPYRFTAIQYYMVQLVTHLIGSLIFGFIVLMVSAISSTSFVAVVVNVAIVGVPYLAFDVLNLNPDSLKWVEKFSFSTAVRVTRLFQTPASYSVFGLELSYLILYIIVMALITVGTVFATWRIYRSREVIG